jgi:SAM-dependent methyltransferase
VRGEYVQMVADAALPKNASLAFDIGVGTGVLSAVLAKRGVARVIATDQDQRALSCARENLARWVSTSKSNCKWPTCSRKAARRWWCVIRRGCRPVQARRSNTPSTIRTAACCAASSTAWRPIRAGRRRLADPVRPGRALGLRPREQLLEWIAAAGLKVIDRIDVRPVHPRASDATDPLHAARAAEVTSLWKLGAA